MDILDIIGIIIVFAVTLWIGVQATKKTKTSDDFLMANKSLGKIQAGFSMAATDIGGNAVVGAVAYAYTVGLSGVWYNWGAVLPMLLLAFVLAKQLRRLAVDSIPELLGKRYGNSARLISVIAQLLAMGASLGIQFTVAATAVSTITGLNFNLALFISVIVVVIYTMGGGLLAVVNTDVFQFLIIIISIILAIPFLLINAGGMSNVVSQVPEGFFNIIGAEGVLVPISLGLLYAFDYATNQHILQRVFASKDSDTARFAFLFSSVMYVFFGLAIAFIGVIAFVVFPGIEDTKTIYPTIIKNILPSGISGLALGGLFAAAMSTSDSKIMATSQLFINDIYKPFIKKGQVVKDEKVLSISRWVTLIICVFGVGVSLLSDSLVQMMYVGGLFYGTAVFVPMLASLYWKRGTSTAAVVSIVVTALVGLYSEYFMSGKIDGILGMPSNLLAFIVSLILYFGISFVTKPPTKEQIDVIEQGKLSTI